MTFNWYYLTESKGFTALPGIRRTLGLDTKNDFLDILKKNEIRIGVATMGDRPTRKITQADRICAIIKYFKENGCSIVIMACNKDNHDGIECIKNEDPNYIPFKRERIQDRTKQGIANRTKNNEEMARQIFSRLEEELQPLLVLNQPVSLLLGLDYE